MTTSHKTRFSELGKPEGWRLAGGGALVRVRIVVPAGFWIAETLLAQR
jgi:hypothetical protein